MSSIATFYLLPETKRTAFAAAHRDQKTVTYKRGFFGTKEQVTGERFFWEYLDEAAAKKIDFDFSGFAFIEYFFTFAAASLPAELERAINGAALDDHHYDISAGLASSLAGYLHGHPPDLEALRSFVADNVPAADEGYAEVLRETHDFLVTWFSSIAAGSFGVIHITF